jgi:hypothetical protein
MYGYPCAYCRGTVQPRPIEREAFKIQSVVSERHGCDTDLTQHELGNNLNAVKSRQGDFDCR